jgi:hypothetical protein
MVYFGRGLLTTARFISGTMVPKTLCPRQLLRSRLETKCRTSPCSSPPTSSARSLTIATSPRWSWSSRKPEVLDRPPSPPSDEEHFHILKARQRLARREIELRQIIRHCNREIDGVRQKLFKDLRVMEVFKEEIDKAGSGELREELECHFRDGK